jgi:hypothetical protein
MPLSSRSLPIPAELIQQRILVIRGKRVLLDADLARFYGVTTFNLNKAVTRNRERFLEDFAFHVTPAEAENLIYQSGISSDQLSAAQKFKKTEKRHGGARKPPRVFTEQGVAMLASVLRSPRAVAMSVAIVRAFAELREMPVGQGQLAGELAELETKLEGHDEAISNLFEAIRQLIEPSAPTHGRKTGFNQSRD